MNLLTKAIVLVEDRRFYYHFGIDPIALFRAFLVNVRERRYAQGGSTITQQLARTLYLNPRKTLNRKIKEAVIALWLELTKSKKEILQAYINKVYLGQSPDGPIRGFNEASQYYFKKPLDETTVFEQVALVAALAGPNKYKPLSRNGLYRTHQILKRLFAANLIDRETFVYARLALIESYMVHYAADLD